MMEMFLSSTLPVCFSLSLVLLSLNASRPSIAFPIELFPAPETPSSTILRSCESPAVKQFVSFVSGALDDLEMLL